jgi:hypothetical protein
MTEQQEDDDLARKFAISRLIMLHRKEFEDLVNEERVIIHARRRVVLEAKEK